MVTEGSGCLDLSATTAKYSLSRTHYDMNKFADTQNEDYLTVKAEIQAMATQAPSLILARQSQGRSPLQTS